MLKPKYEWQSGCSQWALLKFYVRIWIQHHVTNHYWFWRNRNVACLGCGAKGSKEMLMLCAIFGTVWGDYVCHECRHDPKPECGPNCPYCRFVDEEGQNDAAV
jgi:hypothetical protein